MSNPDALKIYLNDHLAGATGGAQLFSRSARKRRGFVGGEVVGRLAREVREDRATLLSIMRALDVPVAYHRIALGLVGERVALLKTNGRLLSRSPLSDFVEVEAMMLGVEGKVALWTALLALAPGEPRLDADQLTRLVERGRDQVRTLEELRLRLAVDRLRRGGGAR